MDEGEESPAVFSTLAKTSPRWAEPPARPTRPRSSRPNQARCWLYAPPPRLRRPLSAPPPNSAALSLGSCVGLP